MLVEALMDCGDAEGVAPKDLFTWMASRYPLQTNFRPSASQALQKAYKRGRFEKLAGGKYRLNPNWEGGATAKRTTRRPQTLAQTTYAMHHSPPPPPPPFTQAPLHQHNHPNNQLAHGQHPPPYNGYQYQYPYGHYAGYAQPHQQQQQQPQPVQEKRAEQAPSHPAPAASKAPAKPASEEKDEGDAWEAAQHILQAINFGNIASGGADASSDPHPGSSSGSGAVLPPSTADAGDIDAVLSALADAAAAASSAAEPRTTLTDDERASLQAQLALLAAQLTEIAEADEDEDEAPVPPLASAGPIVSTHSAQSPALPLRPAHGAPPESDRPVSQPPLVQPAPQSAPGPPKSVNLPPPPIAVYSGTHLSFDVNAFPEAFPSTAPTPANASGAQTDVSELGGEDSDDDDMEDVVVPLHGHDVLRT
ncbi:hypothetical protein BD311DRAFT_656062 [Dichomitus squalens]|uniref:Histone H1 n=1 Tax=Dichomitus squalens TaxID=114155 RepID=A0A4Q9MV92_9APHY|nr:hypothetical protein BD311DRAFT_656062 [Dichomitus squalens]